MFSRKYGDDIRTVADTRNERQKEEPAANRRFQLSTIFSENPSSASRQYRLFDGFLQGFARYKLGNFGSLDFDFCSGLRISTRTGFAFGHLECSEADESDIIAFFECLGDGREQSVDSGLGIFFDVSTCDTSLTRSPLFIRSSPFFPLVLVKYPGNVLILRKVYVR